MYPHPSFHYDIDRPRDLCCCVDDGKECNKKSVRHIVWDSAFHSSSACQRHYEEALREHVWYADHKFDDATCGAPQSRFVPRLNRCIVFPPGLTEVTVKRELELAGV